MLAEVGHSAVSRTIVSTPQVEYGVGLGIGDSAPRLSWKLTSDLPGFVPEHYEITVWNASGSRRSYVRKSPEQVFQRWPFEPLRSRERVEVSVRVGVGGEWSAPSERTTIEVGLLASADWSAHFISPKTFGGMDAAAPLVFTEIELLSAPVSARLYVTAKGLYEVSINGTRVGDDLLTPGWTAYDKRLRYQTYDVTNQLSEGVNLIAAMLGNGWYRGQLVWPGNRSTYGDRLALLAQLEVVCADGSTHTFSTDESWRATESGILFDDLYDGQSRDLRISNNPAGKLTEGVDILDDARPELVAPTGPPVRVTEEVAAVRLLTSPSGKVIADFGQNLVGWVQLRVRGLGAGDLVTVRHAEVLENGELGVRPLRSAKATSSYFTSGAPAETLVPTFTFHGFRYAEVTGVPGLELDDIRALVLGSDLRRTGWFESSSAALNQLHSNVVWSMRGNFLDVPTDCPARDERLGWTGDIQVFAPTANYLYNTSGFLAGWLRDLAAEQQPDGSVPNVIPDALRETDPARAAWGDASTIVPMALFDSFDDLGLVERQYPSMVLWVEKVSSLAGERLIWDEGQQFGDWLDPTAPPDDPSSAQADPGVVATAHFARSTFLVTRAAQLLGRASDAEHYANKHAAIVRAFNREYVGPDGTVHSDCQTVYALALKWDLLDSEHKRRRASERLAELVREADRRVSTGFVGTPVILDALEIAGHPELAMSMVMEEESPSWLYAVKMGATTIWERWDSMLPDGSINPGTMTSFNHYAYGAVADWLHRSVAGLSALASGYRRARIRPNLVGDLTSASARHESPYGEISVAWARNNGTFSLDVEIPTGVTAEVWLPGEEAPRDVTSGRYHYTVEDVRAAASSLES